MYDDNTGDKTDDKTKEYERIIEELKQKITVLEHQLVEKQPHKENQPNKRTTKQPGDPIASLLLTSEKAVFCRNTPDNTYIASPHLQSQPT